MSYEIVLPKAEKFFGSVTCEVTVRGPDDALTVASNEYADGICTLELSGGTPGNTYVVVVKFFCDRRPIHKTWFVVTA